ncbi:phosphonate ABC transporter, permease protein PhnE [Falsirhodobacter algicola]|uniref:Phosphonate ABC transporter, permease protein PhnE n=1 Tax=Falsirhodobacter algicola TaxID=2692330 RepID=A0A8J8MV61_9RHOB|nr:phosphonate ABC transporter, permease protein PhnE [Falsirhodobacter algicola]QUS37011.1 phosphonate ABC transporter, permease protein PhnE [Falsirhodobacter algicola]
MTVAILADTERRIGRSRLGSFALLAGLIAYLVYVFFAFDIPQLSQRVRLDNAAVLLRDTYSHRIQVTRDNRRDATSVAVDGERNGLFPEDRWPDWVRRDGAVTVVQLSGGTVIRYDTDAVRLTVPDYGTVTIDPTGSELRLTHPGADMPDWISASGTRVDIRRPEGRLTVTRARTETFRYVLGWPMFFFTTQSPFYYMSWPERVQAAFSPDQIRPGQSNAAAMWSDFWHNPQWRHADVAWAIFETLLMAFLGTMLAAIISVPLSFLAARNFAPSRAGRFGIRRVFDFARGVDGLIWTIILARAFGPGPMTGALAIMLTDIGSFGKLFSEALENTDEKQVEGLRSTGANALQRSRFGVIPQVMPVILSQVLYMLEANTRGATVIGAIVGGGIGLLLTQAIQTQKDWEDVTYYIILVVLMVMVMDTVSGRIRRRLIRG